jgi:hypothetical protein
MNKAKISWKDVKPVLSGFSSTQLLGLVQDLYRLNAENASFMHARFLSDDTKQGHLAPYMTKIQGAISPKEPWKQDVKLAEGRKAISEFKKANGNIRDTLTLMIYYVKCGNDFTLEFGDIDEGFYDSLCSMFSMSCQTTFLTLRMRLNSGSRRCRIHSSHLEQTAAMRTALAAVHVKSCSDPLPFLSIQTALTRTDGGLGYIGFRVTLIGDNRLFFLAFQAFKYLI